MGFLPSSEEQEYLDALSELNFMILLLQGERNPSHEFGLSADKHEIDILHGGRESPQVSQVRSDAYSGPNQEHVLLVGCRLTGRPKRTTEIDLKRLQTRSGPESPETRVPKRKLPLWLDGGSLLSFLLPS